MLSEKQINELEKIAKKFDCDLLLPPACEINNPFFDVSAISKNKKAFGDFLSKIGSVGGVTYDSINSIKKRNRLFLEVRNV